MTNILEELKTLEFPFEIKCPLVVFKLSGIDFLVIILVKWVLEIKPMEKDPMVKRSIEKRPLAIKSIYQKTCTYLVHQMNKINTSF